MFGSTRIQIKNNEFVKDLLFGKRKEENNLILGLDLSFVLSFPLPPEIRNNWQWMKERKGKRP